MTIAKAYCDGPEGQIHLHILGQAGPDPDLYCLHPAPFSGLAFETIMPHLATGRRVIAPDFPGHGGSHAHRADAAIGDYAAAMLSVVEQMSDGPVDLFGFHSGCLVTAEMALQKPETIRRIVICDAPAFEPAVRSAQLDTSAKPPGFTPDLESLAAAWERGITKRIDSQGMERSFAMFVEQLRHGEAMNGGFHAAFAYAVEDRLAMITQPTTVITTRSAIAEASRRAAKLIPDAMHVERPDITRAVLDEAAATTAAEVLRALA